MPEQQELVTQHLEVTLAITGPRSNPEEFLNWIYACLNCNTNHRNVKVSITTAGVGAADGDDCATAINAVAKEHLGLTKLETRNSDAMDFHDLSVWQIKAALEAAYRAGQSPVDATMPQPPAEGA